MKFEDSRREIYRHRDAGFTLIATYWIFKRASKHILASTEQFIDGSPNWFMVDLMFFRKACTTVPETEYGRQR